MKKAVILFLLFLTYGSYSSAQNVGIGDPAPSARLTVSGSETTLNGQGASIKLQNTASTNTWFLRAGANGTTTPVNGFSIADNSGYHFNISAGGNTGFGINPATARLHVNGMIKLEGLNHLEFGAGIAGKELNAGKIGYNGFGTEALAIVGAGTNTTDRAVYFFAEGGTTFSGPINVRGTLQVHGNPGTAGQILTSNGTSAPTWENAAYANNTRFYLLGSEAALTNSRLNLSARYNTNTTDVTVGSNTFTINKTGLYHLEGTAEISVIFSGSPTNLPVFALDLETAPTFNVLMHDAMVKTNAAPPDSYMAFRSFTMNIYITAGTVLSLAPTLFATGVNSFNYVVQLRGHLISE